MINPSYTLIMLSAVGAAAVVGRWTRQPSELSAGQRLGIGLGGFCGAMLAAKLPFALADGQGFLDGTSWFGDGKTILCGLVGGYAGVVVTKWSLGVEARTGDSFAVPVALAIGIGRIACFSAGCCHGTPTTLPWGVVFEVADHLPRHPTQLYEAAFHLTAAVVLFWLYGRGTFRGQLIKLYFIAYFVYRFLTEFIRPEAELWVGLTAYQWGCLVLIPIFAGIWAWDARRASAAEAVPVGGA